MRPRSIALVGASESAAAGWSKTLFDNVRHFGGAVRVYPVNPRRETVWGERCYPSLEALPVAVDLALMITPAPTIPAALRAGRAYGVKAATIYAAGFGEGDDPEGAARADELRAICADGLRLVGPNCMGAVSTRERLYLYPAARVRDVEPGDVALVMQSGGLFQFWLQQAAARGLGFSYAVTSGNELDLDLADYINFFVEDPSTKVICCLAEGIHRPDAFMAAAAKALEARKPILLVKIGRSAAAKRAAQSHTGSLAGDDRVFDAVCERYGVIRVSTLDQLMESALAFRSGRLPAGMGVAMVGYSGASRGLALDVAESERLEFAQLSEQTGRDLQEHLDAGTHLEMPLDLGPMATTDPQRYSRICQIVLRDPNVALLAVQGQLPVGTEHPDPRWFNATAASTDKPVFAYSRTAQNVVDVSRAFQDGAGMSFVQGIPETIAAAKHLIRYAQRVERGILRWPPERTAAPAPIDELLRERDIAVPAEALATSREGAVAAAARIGYPVALKLHSAQAIHKTEADGVVLGLRDDAEVRRAADALFATIAARPELACDALLVQEMVSGLEMIAGVREDAQFGPIVLLGLGGVFVEAFDDVILRLLPVTSGDVREMIEDLRGKALLRAFRGRPERDVDALVRAVVSLGTLFLEQRSMLEDIEVNPLVVLERGRGVRAVDVRTVRRGAV
ncbi:MAG TPA: acetate--CoA ligase family protein [Candidatus Lustribacter sp.]